MVVKLGAAINATTVEATPADTDKVPVERGGVTFHYLWSTVKALFVGVTGDQTIAGKLSVSDATAATHAVNRQTADARYFADLWVPATDFEHTSGTATEPEAGFANRAKVWRFAVGETSIIASSVMIPADWATYSVNYWYYITDGETTGNFVANRRTIPKDVGDAGNSGSGQSTHTITVPGTGYAVGKQTLITQGGGPLVFLELGRNANDVLDTLDADVMFIGCSISRVS